MRATRRRRWHGAVAVLAALLAIALAAALLTPIWLARHGAGWTHAPEDAAWVLPQGSQRLIEQAFSGLHGKSVIDHGVGIVSRGQLSGPGFANDSREAGHGVPSIGAWLSQMLRDRAAGIVDANTADADYVSRLLRQIRAMPDAYRAEISGRDASFGANGAPRAMSAAPLVSNRYVVWLAHKRAPKALDVEVSINPDRPDAAKALAHWAGQGVRDVRWWPAAQGIDPAGRAARAAYRVMAAHHMRLDAAVGGLTGPDHDPVWIAPETVEPALAAGVPVRLRLGRARGDNGQRLMPALFALLREHSGDKARLTVSLAGLLTGDRPQTELEPLLEHPQFFGALRYASNYPAVARADAVNLQALADDGFIARSDIRALHAIYDVNPLLFALVVMRTLHLPYTTLDLPASVFVSGKAG